MLLAVVQSVAEPPPPPVAVAGTGSKSSNTGIVIGIAVGAAVVGLGQLNFVLEACNARLALC